MDKTSLFSEFDKVSEKQWKQKIQFDLKGADYNEKLVWESPEGIKVKPFYNAEDSKSLSALQQVQDHSWRIAQSIFAGKIDLANKKAIDALNAGTESLLFTAPNAAIDWKTLLKEIDLPTVPLYFNFEFLDSKSIERLLAYIDTTEAQLYLNIDIIANLVKTGNWFHNRKEDHAILEEIYSVCHSKTHTQVFGVDTALYQNSGANIVQQLAYGIAHANEYLNHFSDTISNTTGNSFAVTFKVALGSNYFFEIAKIKALRLLWNTLSKAYGIATDCHILAVPSQRNKTLYDYNVNMLRTTTENMSAAIGGANTICHQSYDSVYHKDNEFGERIARNQLLLLKNESYLNQNTDAANGSHYIESLTLQLAEKALELFKQIENSGGFLSQLKDGIVQKKIKESAAKEQALFDDKKLVLVGTNTYPNQNDRMKDQLELYPFVKTEKRKTIIEPVIPRRLSEKMEQNRLNSE